MDPHEDLIGLLLVSRLQHRLRCVIVIISLLWNDNSHHVDVTTVFLPLCLTNLSFLSFCSTNLTKTFKPCRIFVFGLHHLPRKGWGLVFLDRVTVTTVLDSLLEVFKLILLCFSGTVSKRFFSLSLINLPVWALFLFDGTSQNPMLRRMSYISFSYATLNNLQALCVLFTAISYLPQITWSFISSYYHTCQVKTSPGDCDSY